MKLFKSTSTLLFAGLFLALISCGDATTEGEEGKEGEAAEEKVMTTDEFVAEAKTMTYDEFEKKYPRDSEIELEGEVKFPATWDNRVSAKFGTSANDLPLSADFMFEANGGTKEATKEKVHGTIRFKGKVGGAFYMDDEFKRCSFTDCVVQ